MYADIVVPLALQTLTYRLDTLPEAGEGDAVVVGLGRNKIYMGIVWKIHDRAPRVKNLKPVLRMAEPRLTLSHRQMALWEWMADYYMCTLGEVMAAALPSLLKPKGDGEDEYARDTYRPRQTVAVGLHPDICDEAKLNECLESLLRAPKQYSTMMGIVSRAADGDLFSAKVPRHELDATAGIIAALVKKRMISIQMQDAPWSGTADISGNGGNFAEVTEKLPRLTAAQQNAIADIERHFREKETVLLHGVTGSGKTEIYISLIAGHLAAGRDVLYLLPEIALTGQLIRRLEDVFGEKVVAYHSRYGDAYRARNYMKVARGGGHLVVGARSSVFMPFCELGLVIVDEEHDPGFKQDDPAPRYHARDMSIVLAGLYGARTLLGSATPSIESYANASGGKYGLVTLGERYGNAVLPQIIVSDTIRSSKRGERKSHFNKELLDRIMEQVEAGRQVILFQNRRGFSPYVECTKCGHVPQCPNCNVALTLHKADGKLRCHYCGYRHTVFAFCPSCGEGQVESRGFGTEKVEEELAALLPEVRVARLDADTSRSRHSYRSIIAAFERRDVDILVGTQMITKGFDFSGVSLVGVLNADNLLNYPDFRAAERAFQLMTQVAGRSGRRETAGEVVIQTAQPFHPVIRQVAAGDYRAMVEAQLQERHLFSYPPYCRIIDLRLRCRNTGRLDYAARLLHGYLREAFGTRLLGPVPPPVDRVKREHILCFTLKIEQGKSFSRARTMIAECITRLREDQNCKYVDVSCNVDPQ